MSAMARPSAARTRRMPGRSPEPVLRYLTT
jgi:hypothetical protein